MSNLYLIARKLHRFFAALSLIIILLMSLTGVVLKFPLFFIKLRLVNIMFARSIHNLLSPFAAIALLIMAITGLIMYLYPILRKKQ